VSLSSSFATSNPAAVLAVTESTPSGPTQVGIGAVVLTIAIVAVLVWVGYLVTSGRRKRRTEETPKNLQPWLADEDLENTRLNRVLGSAVVSAAVLAILLPVYYVNESHRQAQAAESFDHLYVEEGEHWFEKFECSRCHTLDGSGGSAAFVEPRSGLSVPWTAPSLNDVLFRYSEEEIRFWIEFGRPGTPMPPAGLAGGGAMTVQEVDQVLAYIHEIQLPQAEAVAKVDGAVAQALARIQTGAAKVAQAMFEQQTIIDDITDAPDQFAVIGDFPGFIRGLLADDSTCTDSSAALIGSSCSRAGYDADRDGLSDAAELILTQTYAPIIDRVIVIRNVVTGEDGALSVEFVQNSADYPHLYGLELDPNNPFSMTDAGGHEVADLDTVDSFVRDLDAVHLTLRVTSERRDRFLESAAKGMESLTAAAAATAWDVDFSAVASATGLSTEEAQRAVGLFNAYCARCHTAGYNAGVAFEQTPGSGAWAPALTGGRSVVQFPDVEDQVDFVIRGSNLAEAYGTNGLGRGWMPGFGQLLSEEDIRLIIAFERSL
jgi:mono/diheme cytochrome c family protein